MVLKIGFSFSLGSKTILENISKFSSDQTSGNYFLRKKKTLHKQKYLGGGIPPPKKTENRAKK